MFKAACLLLSLGLPGACFCQDIINYAMVGDNGVTQNAKEAKFLILVKKFSDSSFQRVEYRFTGPMMRVITYKDPGMTVKEGHYREFDERGVLFIEGAYRQGKKDGDWYQLDTSRQPVLHIRYRFDSVLFSWDADSIRIHKQMDNLAHPKAPGDTVRRVLPGRSPAQSASGEPALDPSLEEWAPDQGLPAPEDHLPSAELK